jgi:hypothetical protein
MRYTVYRDDETGNMFVVRDGTLYSVNAVTTPDSKHCVLADGTLTRNCEVIDWRWQCNVVPGSYGSRDECRATKALHVV